MPPFSPRRISVLGATGSVGQATLSLIATHPDLFRTEALTAGSDVDALARAAIRCGAAFAAIARPGLLPALRERLAGTGIASGAGPAALEEAALRPAELVMAAISGAAGLAPALAAIRRGARIALANKECLVIAGKLLMDEARRAGAVILPVDSEHNAIFQILREQDRPRHVERITLTGSGGPFRTWSREAMAGVTPAQALRHPTWQMGAKITIDSATLINKTLEAIEASHLFSPFLEPGPGADPHGGRLGLVIHPQSVVHGLVSYRDGSVLAALGTPDMRIPIAHVLAWPERIESGVSRLDLATTGKLEFEPPDETRFPAVRLARTAIAGGTAASCAMNAANEVAVAAFLENRLAFPDIVRIAEACLERYRGHQAERLEDIMHIDAESRRHAAVMAGRRRP